MLAVKIKCRNVSKWDQTNALSSFWFWFLVKAGVGGRDCIE